LGGNVLKKRRKNYYDYLKENIMNHLKEKLIGFGVSKAHKPIH